jgi:hypothetical protein
MRTVSELRTAVREAWAPIPAPPEEDLQYMAWGWGEQAEQAFVGVAPVDVDITSRGFHAATPLLDLPPRAAAAYLGTFLDSLLKGIEFQQAVGIFTDVTSRAHTLTCLTLPRFWEKAIRPHLPLTAQQVLAEVVAFLVSQRKLLALTQQQVDTMTQLAGTH